MRQEALALICLSKVMQTQSLLLKSKGQSLRKSSISYVFSTLRLQLPAPCEVEIAIRFTGLCRQKLTNKNNTVSSNNIIINTQLNQKHNKRTFRLSFVQPNPQPKYPRQEFYQVAVIYNYSMQISAKQKCYQCGSSEQLMQYDEEDGICQKCYDEQVEQMLYYKGLRINKYPEIDQIDVGIYLGNEDAATSENILKERDITAICVCGSYLSTPFDKDPKYAYKVYLIQDFPKQEIKQHFAEHHEWMSTMRQQKRNILVHCAAGVSRSASFMVAYFMREKKMPFGQALKFVKDRRKCINPNSGFRRQLIEYNQLLGLPVIPDYNEYFHP